METAALVVLALGLATFFVAMAAAIAYVMHQLHKLILVIGIYREGRRFFKQIERFRRDFSS